jgi:hypothetical protein
MKFDWRALGPTKKGGVPPHISPQSIQSKLVNSKVVKNKDLTVMYAHFGGFLETICCAIRSFSVDFSKI